MSESNTAQQQSAQKLKEEGNQFFKLKKYDRAIEFYTKCIELEPKNSVYYSNRSACYQNISDYRSMVRDAKQSIELDPNFTKGYFRLAKGLMELNRFGKAYQVLWNVLNNQQLNKIPSEERSTFESELNKCIQKLQDEQALLEKTQELVNPFSNMNNLNSVRRIEMEMRRDFYLNHFVKKEHKIVIIEKLDDLLKAMKSIVKKVGNFDQQSQLGSANSENDGKILLGEKEQDLINEEFKNRALPTSCLNWRYQVDHIEPVLKELKEMGIDILEICAVIMIFFSRPEVSYKLLKRMFKSGTNFISNENKVHAYVLLAQSHLFWKGVPRREIGLSPNNKPLQYLRSALSLLEKVDKKNYNSNVNHILVWTYINLIQQCCLFGDEVRLSVEELEHAMNDFYQILFILDSSYLTEYSHINALSQDGIRFWFAQLQGQLGAFDQFQRVSLLPDNEVASLVEKIFNEFHSANLPLPKQCLNKFFLHALSESLLMRNNLEGFLRNIRLGLLSIGEVSVLNEKNKGFLEKTMHSFHYALALQCFQNRYCFRKTDHERNLLKQCIQRFNSIVNSYNSTKINLLENLELHDLFIIISMYGSVSDLCDSFSHFCTIVHLTHRDYSYLLTRLLSQTVRIPKKIKSLTDQTNEGEILFDYYYKSLSIISDEDSIPKSGNLITSTLKINKEIEWLNNNEYWSQGFDQESKVLLIKDGIDLRDVKKYTQRYQSCSLTCLEISSDLHFNLLKEILKGEEQIVLKRAFGDLKVLESLSGGSTFDVLETSSHLFKQEKTLQELVQNNLREGGLVKLALPSQYMTKFVKSVRNFLIQSKGSYSNLFERDEFDNIPTLRRAPTKDEVLSARELLSVPPSPFIDQISKLAEFYNLNSFADLIFSPLWNDLDENNKLGFSFEKMAQFVEKTLGLRIISLSTNLMPFQTILQDYIDETKDFKCRDWKAIDLFAKSNSSYFTSPVYVLCEKPVKKVDIDKKKDPLGLKKYLHKFSK